VPLIYEGRFIAQHVQQNSIDKWFEKVAAGLNEHQMQDLKKKYSRMNVLGRTEHALYAKAVDISDHFSRVWKDTGFKGQIVAPNKPAAIRLKEILDSLGQISSEVIISGPNKRDSGDEVDEEGAPEDQGKVEAFWKKMMTEYGDEEAYNRNVIDAFKGAGGPDVIIVVSKLLTGFDCDRNTALYICKNLTAHNLLQAIARVNRNCELPLQGGGVDEDGEPLTLQKQYGYIYDYEGLLEELNAAMCTYKALQGFDPEDLKGVVTPIHEVISELPKAHRKVLDLFKPVKNKLDHEQMEQHLRDDQIRDEFSKLLSAFARVLEQAVAAEKVYDHFTVEQIEQFKADWRRLTNLRRSAALRYQDEIDMREYEPRILQLLNDNIVAEPAEMIIHPINLSNQAEVNEAVDAYGTASGGGKETARAKADRIERAATRYLRESYKDADPAQFKKFSQMIDEALKAYAQKRLDDQALAESLEKIAQQIVSGKRDEPFPEKVRGDSDAVAFFGVILPRVAEILGENADAAEKAAEIATKVKALLIEHRIVRFWANEAALNRFKGALDDYFFDYVGRKMGLKIAVNELDELQAALIKVAQSRFPDA
jgi:type I restriction enzyme R subunit